MTAATILPLPRAVFYDPTGAPLAAGYVYTYVPGGTTPKTTWQDAGETTPNANPILLDANGSCLLYGSGNYQITVTDSLGNQVPAYSGLSADVVAETGVTPTLATIAALRACTVATVPGNECFVQGYYTNADGGEGPFCVQIGSAADNGGTVIVDASGRTWVRQASGAPFSVAWFGAAANGTTDATTAIRAAVAAIGAAGGGTLCYPPGTYLISSTILTNSGTVHLGSGRASTKILASGSGFDCIQLAFNDAAVKEMDFDSLTQRTSGSYINLTTAAEGNVIEDVGMNKGFIGINCSGNGSQTYIDRVEIRNTYPGTGIGIQVTGGNDTYLTHVLMDVDNPAGGLPAAGVSISSTGGVWMTDCDFIHQTNCIQLVPSASSDSVLYLFLEQVACDTSTYGILINPANGRPVTGCFFINCWTASCQNGVYITGTGPVDTVEFVALRCVNNSMDGFVVFNTATVNLQIHDSVFSGNSQAATGSYSGILVASGVNKFAFRNNIIGAAMGYGNTQEYGINIQPGSSGLYEITGNQLLGNVTAGLSDLGSGNAVVQDNTGWNPVGPKTITVGASPFTYVSGHSPESVYVSGGTVSSIKLGGASGTTALVASPATMYMGPNESVTVIYSSTPSMVSSVH